MIDECYMMTLLMCMFSLFHVRLSMLVLPFMFRDSRLSTALFMLSYITDHNIRIRLYAFIPR